MGLIRPAQYHVLDIGPEMFAAVVDEQAGAALTADLARTGLKGYAAIGASSDLAVALYAFARENNYVAHVSCSSAGLLANLWLRSSLPLPVAPNASRSPHNPRAKALPGRAKSSDQHFRDC